MAAEDIEALNAAAVVDGGMASTKELTLEAQVLLVTMDTVSKLEEKSKTELAELRERQAEVTFLHKLLKAMNFVTDDKGAMDLTDHADIKELLTQAVELGLEVDVTKNTYTKEERTLLVENIRMTTDDLNMQNDMQIQTISRLTNERYEAFQMARSIMKPLHEDKINKARAIAR